jgi:hypothetical protein
MGPLKNTSAKKYISIVSLELKIILHNFVFQVPMVYNAEEMMGDDNEGMVAIGMVEEEGEHEQVLLIANISRHKLI